MHGQMSALFETTHRWHWQNTPNLYAFASIPRNLDIMSKVKPQWSFCEQTRSIAAIIHTRAWRFVLPGMPWWRHQMETFFALLALCAGNSPVTGEFPAQKPVTRSFDVFLIPAWINGWWFETPSRPLWRHCNAWMVFILPNTGSQHKLDHVVHGGLSTIDQPRGNFSIFYWVYHNLRGSFISMLLNDEYRWLINV